jgi:hypothetical protein
MSPLRTLRSCGSSSRLDRRKNLPIRVTRRSSRHACVTIGPSSRTVIVRNLKMTNSLAFKPPLGCRNMIGPGLSSLTATAAIKKSGEKNTIAAMETTTSRARLTALSKGVNATLWRVRPGATVRPRTYLAAPAGFSTDRQRRRPKTGTDRFEKFLVAPGQRDQEFLGALFVRRGDGAV